MTHAYQHWPAPPLVVWEDLRFPAQAINPAGIAAPPALVEQGTLEFDGTIDNVIAGFAQMPHGWRESSVVRPHIHLIAPTANPGKNSRWRFEYNRANVNGAFDAAYGSYSSLPTVTVANPDDEDLHFLVSFGDLSMTGMGPSAGILWKITRLANTDALDDDITPWALLEFDLHYQINRLGTTSEF